MPVEVSCDLKRASHFTRILREEAPLLMRLAGREDCELSILLTSDRRMRQLNAYYRFRDRPTDVLSFGQMTDGDLGGFATAPGEYRPADSILLGDVVISLDTAARQAREMNISVAQRLRTLLVHGFLHLLGHDHERSKDARIMFEYQDRLESALEQSARGADAVRGQTR